MRTTEVGRHIRAPRAAHDGLPPSVTPADNELDWRMALDRLAALVEAARSQPRP